METSAQNKIFVPRYPTRNTGFVFIVILLVMTLVTVIFLLNVVINDRPHDDPNYGQLNWVVLVISIAVGVILLIGTLQLVRKILNNQPRRVILELTQLVLQEDKNASKLVVPYAQVTAIEEGKQALAEILSQGQYEINFKQIWLVWQENGQEHSEILSERDTEDFDELMDALWERCPLEARGIRTFDR